MHYWYGCWHSPLKCRLLNSCMESPAVEEQAQGHNPAILNNTLGHHHFIAHSSFPWCCNYTGECIDCSSAMYCYAAIKDSLTILSSFTGAFYEVWGRFSKLTTIIKSSSVTSMPREISAGILNWSHEYRQSCAVCMVTSFACCKLAVNHKLFPPSLKLGFVLFYFQSSL